MAMVWPTMPRGAAFLRICLTPSKCAPNPQTAQHLNLGNVHAVQAALQKQAQRLAFRSPIIFIGSDRGPMSSLVFRVVATT